MKITINLPDTIATEVVEAIAHNNSFTQDNEGLTKTQFVKKRVKDNFIGYIDSNLDLYRQYLSDTEKSADEITTNTELDKTTVT